ncbi:NAD(P)-binding protein [Meredithblackwellia eburnea MCA 4105]
MRCPDAFTFLAAARPPRTNTLVAPLQTAFILGAGYIAGSLLDALQRTGAYKISVLVRNPEQAAKLLDLGINAILADLDSEETIRAMAKNSDVILHAAASDHLPSVKAILKGLKDREETDTPAVFIHLTGAGSLMDKSDGSETSDVIYSDTEPGKIDSLPEGSSHKAAHKLISETLRSRTLGSTRLAVVLPGLIYGVGSGPFNKLSSQVPGIIREALKDRQVSIPGAGAAIWSNIHVANLASYYVYLISHLQKSPLSLNPYYLPETSATTMLSISLAVHKILSSKGLVDKEPRNVAAFNTLLTNNARSRGVRLRDAGWKGDAEGASVREAIYAEVELILDEAESQEWVRIEDEDWH